MIIDKFDGGKKVYHWLMEIKSNDVLFIFKTSDDLVHFNQYFLKSLVTKYKNIYFVSTTCDVCSERLIKKYKYIFKFNSIDDLEFFNKNVMGIPNLSNLPKDFTKDPLLYYFGEDDFSVIYIDNDFDNENLPILNETNIVLVGDKIKCCEIVNNNNMNPVIVNNNFLIPNILNRAKQILIRKSINTPFGSNYNYTRF